MKNNKLSLSLILIPLLLFFSCKKEAIPPIDNVEEEPCWQLHPEIELDRRLLIQSYATEDNLFLLSHNYFLKMDEQGLVQEQFISEEGNYSLYDYPMLNDKIFAIGLDVFNLGKINIYSSSNPAIFTTIDIKAIDSTVIEINYFSGNGMVINDSNKLLFSVGKEYVQGVPDPYLYLWMFDVMIEDNLLTIEFDQEIKIEIPGTSNTLTEKSVSGLSVFDNEFYCSITRPVTTFKINNEGEYEELFPLRHAKIFSRNDTLFALGHIATCDIGYAIKPPNANWTTYSLGLYDGCWGQFYQVNDQFIMVIRDQLWVIKVDPNSIREIKELDASCIQSTSIRSLVNFKDKIYLATHEGLYFKKLEAFFTYKEE
ncbi:MAG: hypothetical protein AB8F94_10785 [Saprospiraceae bacterium]